MPGDACQFPILLAGCINVAYLVFVAGVLFGFGFIHCPQEFAGVANKHERLFTLAM